MKIVSLSLCSFRNFPELLKIEGFSPAANVFVGRNGAGKSSVLAAIQFVIDAHRRIGPAERRMFVNENSSEIRAFVEIQFENQDRAFPAGPLVSIRRTVTQKQEEYTVDGKGVSREEMAALFESAGVSKTMPYFVVEQGRIGELANMAGEERMEVVRELAGSAAYEKDKQESEKIMQSSLCIEEKIEDCVAAIKEKALVVEEDRKRREVSDTIEKQRAAILKELYRRELHEIKNQLEALAADDSLGDTTLSGPEAALRARLESVLALLMQSESLHESAPNDLPGNEHPEDGTNELQQRLEAKQKIEQIEKELETAEKQTEALEAEIREKEEALRYAKVVEDRLYVLRMHGDQAVAAKIQELKSEISQQGMLHCPQYTKEKEDVLQKRRDLWREEKEVKERKQELEKALKEKERAFLLACRAFALSSEIRNLPGVIGYIYELVSVPPEILPGLSAACASILTSLVVQDTRHGIELVRKHGIEQTVIPLAGIRGREKKSVPDLLPLSSYVSCIPEFAGLVDYLFGSLYFTVEFEAARNICRRFGVDVVTSTGEYFRASGVIIGGRDAAGLKFSQFASIREEFAACAKKEEDIREEILRNTEKYNEIATSPARELQSAYRSAKIELLLLEHGELAVEEELHLKKMQHAQLVEQRTRSLHRQLLLWQKKRDRLESGIQAASLRKEAEAIERRLLELGSSSTHQDKAVQRRRLEVKYRRVHKKLLAFDVESTQSVQLDGETVDIQKAARGALLHAAAQLKKKAAEYIAPRETAHDTLSEYAKISERLAALKEAKQKILQMQQSLEEKKEQVIGITVQQIKQNFEHFFHKLTGGTAKMVSDSAENRTLDIYASFNGEGMVGTEELSSGQRTITAICVILSIQRIYEAPFYLIDEFDANLDSHVLQNLIRSKVLGGRQIFVCTFRKETLLAGEKFYHVSAEQVQECTRESAEAFVCTYFSPPEEDASAETQDVKYGLG